MKEAVVKLKLERKIESYLWFLDNDNLHKHEEDNTEFLDLLDKGSMD
jgi:hypothetical protein